MQSKNINPIVGIVIVVVVVALIAVVFLKLTAPQKPLEIPEGVGPGSKMKSKIPNSSGPRGSQSASPQESPSPAAGTSSGQ